MPDSKLRIILDLVAGQTSAGLGAIAKDLQATGAAADDASIVQNKLALAMHGTQDAAVALSAAQKALSDNTDPDKQRELEGNVLKAQVALDNEADSASKLAADLHGVGGEAEQTGLSFTELNSVLSLAKQAYGAIAGAIKAVIDPTIEYAKQVRDLSRTIGASAEQSSMLIQAADDMQVSYGSLSSALEAAIRKGIEPTIDGIGALADEYNAIQDPIAKTKFLMDNFGRSGADLAPLMEKGAAGIAELGKSARNSGLVMDKEAVTAARNYEKATDDLGDAFHGLTYNIAGEALPALTKFINTEAEAIGVNNLLAAAIKSGAISQQDAADIEAARAHGFFNIATETKYLLDIQEKYDAEIANSQHLWEASFGAIEHAARATMDDADALGHLGKVAPGTAGALREVGGAIRETVDAGSILAAGLSGAIGDAQESYNAVIAETTPEIAKLTQQIEKYQRSQGQTITVTEDATTSAAEYELANIKAATAAQKLAESTADPHSEEYLKLAVASENAAASVIKLGEGFGFTKEYTLDYTKKIQEANGSLDELYGKQAAAEEQLRRTTAEFVFQKISAGLDDMAMLKLAESMGLMDPASAAAAEAALNLRKAFDEGQISAEEFNTDADTLAKTIASLTDKHITITVDNIRNEIINTINNGVIDNRGGGTASGGGANTNTTTSGAGHIDPITGQWVPGFAAGVDMIVPPGFPNDSFLFRAQSGERLRVTPAGQAAAGSGVTIINNTTINDQLAASMFFEQQRQQTIRAAEGLM